MKQFAFLISIILLSILFASCSSPLPVAPTPTDTNPPATTEATEIVPQPSETAPSVEAPSPSPTPQPVYDATPIAFSQPLATTGEIAFAGERDGRWHVLVMYADGSGETNLTAAFGDYAYPAWSPDGNRLAMRIDISSGNGIAVMNEQGSSDTGALTGAPPQIITTAFSDAPEFAPDGKSLLYISADVGDWQTYRAALDGSGATTLLSGIPQGARDPKYSPDGSRILFSQDVNRDGNYVIFSVSPDGSGLTQLTPNGESNEMADWSPDGKRIVYSAYHDDGRDLFLMNADGTGVSRLTSDPASEFDPAWSPDGGRIAFVSDKDGAYEIYVINTDGTRETRLTYNQNNDRWPTWRPNSSANGQTTCTSTAEFVADITTQNGQQFTSAKPFSKIWRLKNTGTCAWTPTSYFLRFAGGAPMSAELAFTLPGTILPGASVDIAIPLAAPAALGVNASQWTLIDAQGQPVNEASGSPLALTVSIEVLPPNATLLPAPLYYLAESGDIEQIWRMGSDGATIQQITHETDSVESFDVSPSDGRLAYIVGGGMVLSDAFGDGRQVYAPAADSSHPLWSPDGSWLAYNKGGVRLYNPASGEDRLLIANNPSGDASASRSYVPLQWSPDGSKLAVLIFYWEWLGVGIVSASDGALLIEGEYAEMVAWSRDSQSLLLARASGPGMLSLEPGLMRLPAAPDETPQTLIANTFVWWPTQALDGRLLYFAGAQIRDNPLEFAVSLFFADSSAADPVTLWQSAAILGDGDFDEALWAPDASLVIVKFEPANRLQEILLLRTIGGPLVYLLPQASNLRWGGQP